ncbi:MAG: hypothetical protein JF617_16485 [Burkholderiales bacterium]|nr:hypothetical protein [Burkholderiales bacterium]
MERMQWIVLAILAAGIFSACGGGGGQPEVVVFDQSNAPQKLSDWHFMVNDGKTLTLNASLVPYDLNSALFSDYAFKLRAVYVPPGRQIAYKADGTFDFPVGSAIVKTFYYPKASGNDAAYVAVARRSQNEQGSSIDLVCGAQRAGLSTMSFNPDCRRRRHPSHRSQSAQSEQDLRLRARACSKSAGPLG